MPRSETNASRAPSGDHTGAASLLVPSVSWSNVSSASRSHRWHGTDPPRAPTLACSANTAREPSSDGAMAVGVRSSINDSGVGWRRASSIRAQTRKAA